MNEPSPIVIANIKANQNWQQTANWVEKVDSEGKFFKGTVIFCASSPFLKAVQEKVQSLNSFIKIGTQDISQFEQGAFTGEVAASQIEGICEFTIIGHSERRENFKEDDDILSKKVQHAKKVNIEVIYCVQDRTTPIPAGVSIVAYEPVFAIGTAKSDTPQNAFDVAFEIKKRGNYVVIYGGSVTPDNVHSFLKKGAVDGVLVGTKSLDPTSFIEILKNASY